MQLTKGGITTSVGVPQDSLAAWIETKIWDLGDSERVKYIEQVLVHITNRLFQINMRLEIWGSDSEDAPFTLLQSLPISDDPLNFDIQGQRFFKFIFRDSGVRERWRMHGFEVFGETGGDEF